MLSIMMAPAETLACEKSIRSNVKKTKTFLCVSDVAKKEANMSASDILNCAAESIKKGDIEWAKTLLKEAISKDMEDPEAYNLLGIAYEKLGNRVKANKYFRVAYYMDQSFKAARENLDRTSQFLYNGCVNDEIAWGTKK